MRTQTSTCPACGSPKEHNAKTCRACYLSRPRPERVKSGDGPNPSGLCMCGCGERTSLASCSDASVGNIKGKPLRYVYGHNRRKSPERYIVNSVTGCWEWQGAKSNIQGHGSLRRDGRHFLAHRWYYEQEHGPIPEGMEIHHVCKVPHCVNPAHLQALTILEHKRAHKRQN